MYTRIPWVSTGEVEPEEVTEVCFEESIWTVPMLLGLKELSLGWPLGPSFALFSVGFVLGRSTRSW